MTDRDRVITAIREAASPPTIDDLAVLTRLDRTSLGEILDALEADGVVRREPGAKWESAMEVYRYVGE